MTDDDKLHEGWRDKARDAYSEAERGVPVDIADRLAAARRAAVAEADSASRINWFPLGGALAAALLIVALFVPRADDRLPLLNEQELAAAQDVELLEELEFVAWLVAMEEDADEPETG